MSFSLPLFGSIDLFLWLAGSFFNAPMQSSHSSSTRRFGSPVVLNCLGLFSHPNCHSLWSDQRKGFALCPSSMKWEREKNKAKHVSSKPVPIVLFHQPQSLADSSLPPAPPPTFALLFSPAWPNQPGIEVTIKDEDEQLALYFLHATLSTFFFYFRHHG